MGGAPCRPRPRAQGRYAVRLAAGWFISSVNRAGLGRAICHSLIVTTQRRNTTHRLGRSTAHPLPSTQYCTQGHVSLTHPIISAFVPRSSTRHHHPLLATRIRYLPHRTAPAYRLSALITLRYTQFPRPVPPVPFVPTGSLSRSQPFSIIIYHPRTLSTETLCPRPMFTHRRGLNAPVSVSLQDALRRRD